MNIIFLSIWFITLLFGPPILVLMLWWFIVVAINRYPLRYVQGPTPLPIIGNAIDSGFSPQSTLKNLLRMSKKYRGIFKLYIGAEVKVVLSKERLINDFLSCPEKASKRVVDQMLKPWIRDGLLTSTGNKWKTHRKFVLPAVSFWRSSHYMEIFNSCGDTFLQNLTNYNRPVEINALVNFLTLDILIETLMREKLNSQNGENLDVAQAAETFIDVIMKRTCSCWQRLASGWYFSSNGRKYHESLVILQKYTKAIIARARERCKDNEPDPSDWNFLDQLVQKEKEGLLKADEVEDQVNTFMLTGHQSSTAIISFAMLCLAENSDVQEKLYKEIITIDGPCSSINPTTHTISQLEYLNRVIEETHRLYPSVPILERVIKENTIIGDYTIPKNTAVTILFYALNQDPSIYVKPKQFYPDRFVRENRLVRCMHTPYSAGPRSCIAQQFALLEVRTIIAKVVKQFRILPVPGFKPDLGIAAARLKSYNGIWLKFEKRV